MEELLNTLQQQVAQLQQQNAMIQQQLQQVVQQAVMHQAGQNAATHQHEFLKPPKPDHFKGSHQEMTKVRQWCFSMDCYFDAARAPASDRVPFAVTLLRDSALAWWQSLETEQRPATWDAFKDQIIAYHQPRGSIVAARDKLAALYQKTSVEQYTKDFKDLALNIPDLREEEKMDRYKRGLKHEVRLQVAFANPATFNALVDTASQIDDILFSHRNKMQHKSYYHAAAFTKGGASPHSSPSPMELGAIGYTPRPKLTDTQKEVMRKEGTCFYCRESGHIAVNCPKRKQGNDRSRR